MALTPEIDDNVIQEEDLELITYPTKTYYMDLEKGRIRGFSDDLESMKQVIFLALNTERSTYLAYSDNYGVELVDLIGEPMSYVLAELERRITEALTWDSRIESVDNFEYDVDGRSVHVTFTVHTDFGDIDSESEVEV
jgi:hypothetical protein